MLSLNLKVIGIIVIIFVALLIVWSGMERMASYIIGIYTEIPESKAANFQNYTHQVEYMIKRIDTMTWEDYRKEEKVRLKHEYDIAVFADKIIKKLLEKNQIGK